MLMVSNLIMAPMWSATTDAYIKGDIQWIKRSVIKLRKLLLCITGCLILMVIISDFIYRIWIGNKVDISYALSASVAGYVCVLVWSLSYSNFLNGFGMLRLQTIMTFISAIMYIPICYTLGRYGGVVGVVLGMGIINTCGLIVNKIQFTKIIENKATGIWNK